MECFLVSFTLVKNMLGNEFDLQSDGFTFTSGYAELIQIAEYRNSDGELNSIRQVTPAIHRMARLRGRPPGTCDIPDILYDLHSFQDIYMNTGELRQPLRSLVLSESLYYKLAENLAVKNAKDFGFHERLPDFIDIAKESVTRIVWINWKPEDGENFIDLHKRIIGTLRRHLVHQWGKGNFAKPYSYFEPHQLDSATLYQNLEESSPPKRPIYRLRESATNLPLPAIIATIEEGSFLEIVASLTTMKYYPSKNGLASVANEIGVKKETLSEALDRTLARMTRIDKNVTPSKSIANIVEETKNGHVIKYASGKNVEHDNPRVDLIKLSEKSPESWLPNGLSERDKAILSLAVIMNSGTLAHTTEEIALKSGCSAVVVCRVIKKATKQR